MDDAVIWDTAHKKTYKEEEWHSSFAEEIEKNFPRNSLIAELGAGAGSDAIFFLKQGHSVVAMDISQFALEVLQKKAKAQNLDKNLAIKQVDFGLHQLPIKNSSVDVVYSRISLNYFGSKHTTKIFADIYLKLKPGGTAYLTFKSPEDYAEMEYLQKSAVFYEPNVFIEGGVLRARFTRKQLEDMLKSAGIQDFSVKSKKEDLGERKEGHHKILFANEITFSKK